MDNFFIVRLIFIKPRNYLGQIMPALPNRKQIIKQYLNNILAIYNQQE